jgi:hypothetical protein
MDLQDAQGRSGAAAGAAYLLHARGRRSSAVARAAYLLSMRGRSNGAPYVLRGRRSGAVLNLLARGRSEPPVCILGLLLREFRMTSHGGPKLKKHHSYEKILSYYKKNSNTILKALTQIQHHSKQPLSPNHSNNKP